MIRETQWTPAVWLALGSLGVGAVVLFLKYLGYRWTGSVALYSDALESIVNVITAVIAVLTIWWSAQPADSSHPFGHSKAEYLSAVVEGVLIVLAALAILHAAFHDITNPSQVTVSSEALLVNAFASGLNAAWSWVLIKRGRLYRSPALVADGRHLFTDVVTSVGVLLGVMLAALTGWFILDPLLAGGVALYILWAGVRLAHESVGGLMDEAAPGEVLSRIDQVIAQRADGIVEVHDMKTRQAGPITFIEFHLVVLGAMTVTQAHAICDLLENAIMREVKEARVTIHVEPEGMAKHEGLCFGMGNP